MHPHQQEICQQEILKKITSTADQMILSFLDREYVCPFKNCRTSDTNLKKVSEAIFKVNKEKTTSTLVFLWDDGSNTQLLSSFLLKNFSEWAIISTFRYGAVGPKILLNYSVE